MRNKIVKNRRWERKGTQLTKSICPSDVQTAQRTQKMYGAMIGVLGQKVKMDINTQFNKQQGGQEKKQREGAVIIF